MKFGKTAKSYCQDVRAFCLTVSYYSRRAYNYLRSKCDSNLPALSTIRNWYSSINASPGFTSESFEILKKKAAEYEKEGRTLYVAGMFDEMAIRRHAQFDPSTLKFLGHVDLGGFLDMGRKTADNEPLPIAKEALVFLVSGVTEDFKIPIAYFLSNGLNGDEKAAIINEIIIRLEEIGVHLVSLTFDGHASNIAAGKILGADFVNGLAFIRNPIDPDRKIYLYLDEAHMLKLARNVFGDRNLIDGDGGVISWEYIDLLYEAQKSLPYNLGNKLTKEHMQWEKKKMNVKLAAQTISHDVADSLEFMKEECPKFENVDATVKYIRTIRDTFNIMNSTKVDAIGFKRPISIETILRRFISCNPCAVYPQRRELKVNNSELSNLPAYCCLQLVVDIHLLNFIISLCN